MALACPEARLIDDMANFPRRLPVGTSMQSWGTTMRVGGTIATKLL